MGEERVGGTLRPNVYGDVAFVDGNPAQPLVTPGSDVQQADACDYWDHVDYIIERAAAHRLTLGLLPLFVGYNGDGYKYLTPDRAYDYGLFLGRRYRHHPHLLWILGGDNTPDTEAKRKVWYEVARGITMGAADQEDYRQTLMTYHINGNNSSSQWFHEAPWLDFNMIQVWGNEKEIYPKITQDYQLPVVRPTGLGEGSYEDAQCGHAVNCGRPPVDLPVTPWYRLAAFGRDHCGQRCPGHLGRSADRHANCHRTIPRRWEKFVFHAPGLAGRDSAGGSKDRVRLSGVGQQVKILFSTGLLASQHDAAGTHRKTVVAGKRQVQPATVGAHPLGGEVAVFTGTDIPLRRRVGRRPWAPRFRRVVDGKAACESGVTAVARVLQWRRGMCCHQR